MQGLSRDIHQGMRVLDSTLHEIGIVDMVKFSDEDPARPGMETSNISPTDRDRPDSLMETIAEAFNPSDFPDVIRERMLHEGYIRIDADGLFASDRYVLADQIQSVSGDQVVLNVPKDELIKSH